ncbi:sperm mitochondrial-associated cysteine-rich protein [Monodelphis domestica]|nr:sperm mitochondrial-associated cysteine-rich protein [Monodelphis domestica]XP_016279682.1 sperm mitochondrial-associated cysteine-rich protein [Monodelphis domestica]
MDLTEASYSSLNPAQAPVVSASLPIPAIVFITVVVYLLLLGLVLLARRYLVEQDCCLSDCRGSCRKEDAPGPFECCQGYAEACDFPLPSPARCLDACCPQPMEAGWAPQCPRCCPLCDCACACQLPECQSLNCLCFEIKLR